MKKSMITAVLLLLVAVLFSACSGEKATETTTSEATLRTANYADDVIQYNASPYGLYYYKDLNESHTTRTVTGNAIMIVDNAEVVRTKLLTADSKESEIASLLEKDLFTREGNDYAAVSLQFVSKETYTETSSQKEGTRYFYKVNIKNYLNRSDFFAKWNQDDEIYVYVTCSVGDSDVKILATPIDYTAPSANTATPSGEATSVPMAELPDFH